MAAVRKTRASLAPPPLLPLLPLLLLLMAARPSAAESSAAEPSASDDYRTLLDVVTNIAEQDEYWARAFDQPVYHRLDRDGPYAYFVDKELLAGARDETAAAADADRGDAIRPMRFVRNVMRRRRYRVGTVLRAAVDVLHKSLTCAAYKHAVHLAKLIRVEISRTASDRKAASWSGKAIAAVAGVVIKMAGLRRADPNLLQTAAFLDAYGDRAAGAGAAGRRDKFELTPALDHLSRAMLEYVGRNCVRAPADAQAVAKELRVQVTPYLYNAAKAKAIKTATYKEMFKSIVTKMSELYDALPAAAAGGMSLDRWNEILHFKRKADDEEHRELYRLSRR